MKFLIQANNYIKSELDLISLEHLKKLFDKNIKPDGVRSRAYLKLLWNKNTDITMIDTNQFYFQTAIANKTDGGKVRKFAIIDCMVLDLSIIQNMIAFNKQIIANYEPLIKFDELILGMHFIRYEAEKYGACYGTPDFLHIDDEPLVFIHLIDLTDNALGGDTLIADINNKEIKTVIRLEKPFETLLLTKDFYHAVTPIGSRNGIAKRDILVFSVEPKITQV